MGKARGDLLFADLKVKSRIRGPVMNKQKTVLIIATLDTKGPETLFLKKHIEEGISEPW